MKDDNFFEDDNLNNDEFNKNNEFGDNYLNEEDEIFSNLKEVIEDGCPMTEFVLSLLMVNKPFGIIWKEEKMEKFLKERGYKIISRYSENIDREYKVAIKPDQSCIPETDLGNIKEIFDSEIQDAILEMLSKK